MAMLTWATYCSIMGLELTDSSQAQVEATIPAVEAAIEGLCDRVFTQATYVEWFDEHGPVTETWLPEQYPVKSVLGCYGSTDAISVANANAGAVTMSNDGVTFYLSNSETLASATLAITTGQTLANVVSGLSLAGVTLTAILPATSSSKLLCQSALNVPAGETVNFQGGQPGSYSFELLDQRRVRFWNGPPSALAYVGGYSPIPADLLQAIAICVQQTVAKLDDLGDGAFKSESIGKYSYTLADGKAVNDVVGSNSELFDGYRRIVYG